MGYSSTFGNQNKEIMIIGLTHLHSSFRYLVLLFILLALIDALIGFMTGRTYKKQSKIFSLLALITAHIQLVVGLLLYFLGGKGFQAIMNVEGFMKNEMLRFYAVEHISLMIIAIALITVGYSKAKRQSEAKRKYKTVLIFYGIGLLIIFAMIPWPFMKAFGSWM